MTHIPNRPTGHGPAAYFMQRVWDAIWGGKFPFVDREGESVWNRGPQGYDVLVAPQRGGARGNRIEVIFCENGVEKIYLVDAIPKPEA